MCDDPFTLSLGTRLRASIAALRCDANKRVKILPLRGENVTKSLQQRPHTYPHLRANNKNAAGWGTAQTTPGDQRGSRTAQPPHL
ncbi:unnamed protein product [Plutella xylostella]|uniref:(diamondback moth) hypothetical protein n=1 Tax=Plutella xylostella TaxID=51655 RepID=A0A8S4EUZ5_PLUXY|nr:unnamed protein product [Plutella xylostella]